MGARTLAVVMSAVAFVGAACTAERPEQQPPAPSGAIEPTDVLVLETSKGAQLVDTSTGTVIARDAGSLVAPDGSLVYSADLAGGSTILGVTDASTGELIESSSLEGDLDVRVASVSGRAVALTPALPSARDPWTPVPRARSTVVVADPTRGRPSQRFDLKGNFEPEAFSIHDTRLFLIQYLPAEAPTAYRVTYLDLRTGHVEPVFGKFDAPPERMPGIRLGQVFDPVSEQLYTLYSTHSPKSLQTYDYGSRWAPDSTFVHVLSLSEGWAYCAGLPKSLWGQPATAQAIAPSPDGRTLYVVDSVRGVVSELDTRTLEIRRTGEVELGNQTASRTSATVSSDGSTLFVGSAADGTSVYAIDTSSLQVAGRWSVQEPVTDLVLSKNGSRLYASTGDQVTILDPISGASLGTLSIDGIRSIAAVQTPSA